MLAHGIEANIVVLSDDASTWGVLVKVKFASLNGEVLADLWISLRHLLEDQCLVLNHPGCVYLRGNYVCRVAGFQEKVLEKIWFGWV